MSRRTLFKVTQDHYKKLYEFCKIEERSRKEIADLIGTDHATMVKHLSVLVDLNIIEVIKYGMRHKYLSVQNVSGDQVEAAYEKRIEMSEKSAKEGSALSHAN